MPYWIAALEAAAFPFFCTCAGAASVFLMGQGGSPVLQSAVDGFAGGVMLAASIFSLLLPAIEASTGPAWAACCGGVLLGAGGLLRAYTRSAKDALDAAGISVVRPWTAAEIPCSYAMAERLKGELPALGAIVQDMEYTQDVTIKVLVPKENFAALSERIFDVSCGAVRPAATGESCRAVKIR